MKGSLKLATVAGIGIYVHWTFLFLILFIGGLGLQQQATLVGILRDVVFVLGIFACVVLHELGHALTAKHFGIRTRDITLLPIGGLARLERMPDDPIQELLVALAGPAVNVVIAAVLFALLFATGGLPGADMAHWLEVPLLVQLMFANVFLVLFNMLPAFPMDGGRVLRAFLAAATGNYVRATRIAAFLGQGMAVAFAAGAFVTGNPFLVLIGVFVFFGAQQESRMVQMRSTLQGATVRTAMTTHFHTLDARASLEDVARAMPAGPQEEFPVIEDHSLVGVLPRADLAEALAHTSGDEPVSRVMRRDFTAISENEPLETAIARMRESGSRSLPVVRDGYLVGLLTVENIGELLMLRSALGSLPGSKA